MYPTLGTRTSARRGPRALAVALAAAVATGGAGPLACAVGDGTARAGDTTGAPGATASRVAATGSVAAGSVATDDAGREVRLTSPARRIVSLVPSATRTLLALGARDALVGRTRYDTDSALAALPSVGGGLDPSVEAVLALRPDLVIAWAQERDHALRQQLEAAGVAVFAVRTTDTTDVFRLIARLGALTAHGGRADTLAAGIRRGLAEVRAGAPAADAARPTVLFVVWPDPPMTAGPNTFAMQAIGVAGGRPAFPDVTADWPTVSAEELVRRQPDVIVLPIGENPSHAGATLRRTPGWRELRAVREGRIVELPAELVNNPGPQLAEVARRLQAGLRAAMAAPADARRAASAESTRSAPR